MFVYISRHFLNAVFYPPRKLALLHIIFPGLTTFVVNLAADFKYELKRIITLLQDSLVLWLGAVSLRMPVLKCAMSFSKLSFIPIITQICLLM
jgi:hypothetical protein